MRFADLFAARTRVHREIHRYSQADVARHVEQVLGATVPQTTMSKIEAARFHGTKVTRIEKGTRRIGLDEAVAIAGFFGRTVDEMLCVDCLRRDQDFAARFSPSPAPPHRGGECYADRSEAS